jgi:hypothetical protein
MVFGISFIVCVLGLIVAIFGAMQMGAEAPKVSEWAGDGMTLDVDPSGLGIGVVICGVICIAIALLGCLTCKYKKAWFAIPFVILTLIIGLAVFIIGMTIIGVVAPVIDDFKD